MSPTADLSPLSPRVAEFHQLFGGDASGTRSSSAGGGGGSAPLLSTSASQPAGGGAPAAAAGGTTGGGARNKSTKTGPPVSFSLAAVLALFSRVTSTDLTALTSPAGPYRPLTSAAGVGAVAGPQYPGADGFARARGNDALPLTSTLSLAPGRLGVTVATGTGIPLRILTGAMPKARALKFVEVLSWLLKHGYLRQMHTYIYLRWPWPLARPAAGGDGGGGGGGGAGGGMLSEGGGGITPHSLHSTAAGTRTMNSEQQYSGSPMVAQARVPMKSSVEQPSLRWSEEEAAYFDAVSRGKSAAMLPVCRRLVSYLRDTFATFGMPADVSGGTLFSDAHDDMFDADGMSAVFK
ncbi:hypothetical protein EON68_04550, partial [archaeon]